MNIRYRVELSETERTEIQTMLSGGKDAVRKLKRAQGIFLVARHGTPRSTRITPPLYQSQQQLTH